MPHRASESILATKAWTVARARSNARRASLDSATLPSARRAAKITFPTPPAWRLATRARGDSAMARPDRPGATASLAGRSTTTRTGAIPCARRDTRARAAVRLPPRAFPGGTRPTKAQCHALRALRGVHLHPGRLHCARHAQETFFSRFPTPRAVRKKKPGISSWTEVSQALKFRSGRIYVVPLFRSQLQSRQ